MTVHFGFFTPIVVPINRRNWELEAGPDELRLVLQRADELGYGYAIVGDHAAIHTSELHLYGGRAWFYDPIATFGFAAALTKQLRLLSFVYQIPLRSPLITAKSFATLDVLSGGRAILGVGVGRRPYEAEAAQIDFERRGAMTDEYLDAIRCMWTDQPASFQGEFLRFADLVAEPLPVQRPHPPIWVGGNSRAALRRALRFGEAWIPALVAGGHASSEGDAMRELVDLLNYARSLDIAKTREKAIRVVTPFAPLGGRGERGKEQPPMKAPSDVPAGDVLEKIDAWMAAGVTDFIIELPGDSLKDVLEAMEWFVTEIVLQSELTDAGDE